jgi:hypothetical protein
MRASAGKKIMLSASNLACASAAAALGIKSLAPKLASGEAHYNVGTFGTQTLATICSELCTKFVGAIAALQGCVGFLPKPLGMEYKACFPHQKHRGSHDKQASRIKTRCKKQG